MDIVHNSQWNHRLDTGWEKPQVFPKEVTEVSELYVYISVYIYITYTII